MYNSQERTKLDPRSRKCIFLGYADVIKWYYLWDPTARKVIIGRDVVFAENELQSKERNDNTTKETTTILIYEKYKENDSFEAKFEHNEQVLIESNEIEVRRSYCQTRQPSWHLDYVMASHDPYFFLTEEGEPTTFPKAMKSASMWMITIQEEIEALHRNHTWKLVTLPMGRKAIGNKWVYKIKQDSNDQVERYRARLIVKGYA